MPTFRNPVFRLILVLIVLPLVSCNGLGAAWGFMVVGVQMRRYAEGHNLPIPTEALILEFALGWGTLLGTLLVGGLLVWWILRRYRFGAEH